MNRNINNKKILATTTLLVLLVSGAVRAKDLSNKECKEHFEDTLLSKVGSPIQKGCVCEYKYDAFDEAIDEVYEIQRNCRALTLEEKSFVDLRTNKGYDCAEECQSDNLTECMKDKACKTLVDLKCSEVDKLVIAKRLPIEDYYRVLQNAKKCQASANKLIKQNIKTLNR